MIRSMLLAMALLSSTQMALADPVSPSELTIKDGDTVIFHGADYRLVGFDTPEIATPRRTVTADERSLGMLAKERLQEILSSGAVDLTEVRCSCPDKKIGTRFCNLGRKCGVLTVNGKSVGEILISEGLARPFVCGRNRCPKLPDWPKIIERWNAGGE